MIKVCEAMVECLKKEGIKVVFGYPGAAICPFYDEIYKSDIRSVLVRHEVNGGHIANGYARITGKPAVCIATSGPGATNLLTAIATAYADSVPVICITGQVNSEQIGSDAFQEADITGAAEPFIKHSYLVKDASQIGKIFKEAFYLAGSGRPGPVLIDVPMDVQNELIDFSYPKSVEIRSYKPTQKGNALQVKRVISEIKSAKKPLLCVGGGVFSSNAKSEVRKLAEVFDLPVITTMMGISAFESDSKRFFGMLGMHGSKVANRAVSECDVLILVGARVGDRAIGCPSEVEKSTRVIHIDIDPAEIGKNLRADIPLVGDVKTVLGQILKSAEKLDHTEWIEQIRSYSPAPQFSEPKDGTVNPKEFLSLLSERLPRNTHIVADVGQNQIWAARNCRMHDGRFLTSGGMGTMGYAIPAAIGAKMADEQAEVVAVCGDGSFQMSFMELATAVQHGVDIKVIVMKNNYLGMVRELQDKGYGGRRSAVSLDGSPDFIKLAEAYGIRGVRVNDKTSMERAFDELNKKGLCVVECVVDDDESTL
ncbi:MAG: biosynthetic-type acetolactate synthase large subunit [Ruminococcus sp.]|nr:biosynthetic-type acetolactate synthase large subunit [Ruminococcus sp.]